MKNYSSFISEHTAEFILVPKLVSILREKYNTVVPIFPWLTREGGKLSNNIHGDDKFKVLILFPRRPKINISLSNQILIKINENLVSAANEFSEVNIPVISGCPVIRDFWNINDDPKCIWINLNSNVNKYYTAYFENNHSLEYTIIPYEGIVYEKILLNSLRNPTCKILKTCLIW